MSVCYYMKYALNGFILDKFLLHNIHFYSGKIIILLIFQAHVRDVSSVTHTTSTTRTQRSHLSTDGSSSIPHGSTHEEPINLQQTEAGSSSQEERQGSNPLQELLETMERIQDVIAEHTGETASPRSDQETEVAVISLIINVI